MCAVLLWAGVSAAWAASRDALRLNEEGIALTARGQYEEAAVRFTQALRLSPGEEVIRRNLARVRTVLGHQYLHSGSLSQAQGQYQAALELVPDEAAALLGLGDIRHRNRQPRLAAEFYRRAIAAEPTNPDAYARLAQAYYNQGDLNGALSEWERALSLRPNDPALRSRIEEVQREARVQSGYRERESQHFAVTYEGQRREDIGRDLLLILERAYNDVGYELGAYPPYEVQTIFSSEAEFVTSHVRFLDGKIRVGLRGLAPGNPLLRSVLYHEYTHALIYAVTRGNLPPRWVDEGLAVQMEKGRAPAFKQEAIRLARAGRVPMLDQSPYMHGSAAVEHLIERYGMSRVRYMLQRMGEGVPFAQAFQEAFQRDPATFQREFRDLLVRGY
ncbi:MAG TPA: tetratricopeptide repeat protein [Candidatus Methylomirabilis sp.]|nr:tetratricopeptide repeat protein [Candidatus Methylomirabilis sp.]